MTFRFIFFGGPLDGMWLDGSDEAPARNWYDFAGIAFADSSSGSIGALFETFNPMMISELPMPRGPIRLHTYRISDKMPGDGQDWEIHATHIGPSAQALSASPGAIGKWAGEHWPKTHP